MRTVLCTLPFEAGDIERLRQAFEPAEFISVSMSDDAAIRSALDRADVALMPFDIDDRYLEAPHLRWVHCDHAGLDRSARPAVFARGLVVTGSAGRSDIALAQHAFYFALALTFDARALFDLQSAHQWSWPPDYHRRLSLFGKTLGIVGFGHTGAEMARLGKAFGMRVVAYRRRAPREVPPTVDRMLSVDAGHSLDLLLEESDVVMLALALSDATYHLFGDAQFRRMKPTAYLINLARGGIVDHDALERALRDGLIAGAGLDVTEPEPLPTDSPLWDHPNVVITPHTTPKLPARTERSVDIIVENARRWRAGEPMLNAVTPDDMFTPR